MIAGLQCISMLPALSSCKVLVFVVLVFVIISLSVFFVFIYVSMFICNDCIVEMHFHAPCIIVL